MPRRQHALLQGQDNLLAEFCVDLVDLRRPQRVQLVRQRVALRAQIPPQRELFCVLRVLLRKFCCDLLHRGDCLAERFLRLQCIVDSLLVFAKLVILRVHRLEFGGNLGDHPVHRTGPFRDGADRWQCIDEISKQRRVLAVAPAVRSSRQRWRHHAGQPPRPAWHAPIERTAIRLSCRFQIFVGPNTVVIRDPFGLQLGHKLGRCDCNSESCFFVGSSVCTLACRDSISVRSCASRLISLYSSVTSFMRSFSSFTRR